MHKSFKLIIVSLGVLVLLSTSCDKASNCDNAVKAELKDLTGLDGCGMVIELSNGDRLEPTNLSDFSINIADGQKIWVEYHVTSGASVCMVGEIVEIDCIGER
ncbi:MAG: hypothetical protein ACJA1C_001195 [Crocinitomicaceae bacterium]|jgi:hypothetical protein